MPGTLPSTAEDSRNSASAEDQPSLSAGVPASPYSRWHRIVKVVAGFFFGQGTLQGINVVISLFLVRALSVEHYAQFGLALGFQTSVSMLMDLGFASTIIPLVGERVSDRALVGSYLRAAKYLRDRAFWTIGPITSLVFLQMMHKRSWGWSTQAVLLLSVLLALYSSGPISYYSAPLILYRRLRAFYLPQTIAGLTRLLTYVGLAIAGALNGSVAAALSAINLLANATLLRRNASRHIEWPKSNEPAVNREVLRYILPAIPAFVFSAFQSQIALFLINAFGSTRNVAEVAALGRLGQCFIVLTSFNTIIIEPRIARIGREHLLRTYLRMTLLPCCICLTIVPLAFAFPLPFIWLIGPKYSSLSPLAGWVVLSACLSYAAHLIWIMNRARKWVFWRGTILEIGAMLVVDVCFLTFVGVRTTRQAILFILASTTSTFCTHAYIGIYGFLRGEQGISESRPELPEAGGPGE